MSETIRFCVFSVGEHRFAIDVACVQEVLQGQRMTPVPLANPEIVGLVNLRSKIVPVIDVRRRLGLLEQAGTEVGIHVVVITGKGVLSLQMETVTGVLDVARDAIEAVPDTVSADCRSLLRGMVKNRGRLVLVLDLEAVVGFDSAMQDNASGVDAGP